MSGLAPARLNSVAAERSAQPPRLPLDADAILAHYAPRTGWNTDTLLLQALGYIANQHHDRAFLEHLEHCALEDEQVPE